MVTLTNVPKAGPSFDFYKQITVSNSTFNTQPDMIIPFSTYGIIILLETGSASVSVSFNGTDVHEVLNTSLTPAFNTVTYLNRVNSLVWFKSSGSVTVSLRAWAIR